MRVLKGMLPPLRDLLATCRIAVTATALCVFVLLGCRMTPRHETAPAEVEAPIRAVWVTRWDYKSPGDIAKIMHNCRAASFNTVLFQVRGNGTAFYRSKLEPWADELGGKDPGFDPLTVACKEAHQRDLALQAWVNVMPGWTGKQPPTNPRQLYHAHPDWFWYDAAGRRQPLGWYSSLNPCYPEVRQYLVAVMREIVENYPIDGLHMDYIRFPNEWTDAYGPGGRVPDYPRDATTLALFRQATGQTPDSAPRAWDEWRTAQVTQLVRDIHSMIEHVRPRVELTAGVGAVADDYKRSRFQDSHRWIAEGLLDAVFPMNYAENMATFTGRLRKWSRLRKKIPVVTGVMVDKRLGTNVVKQLDSAQRATGHFAAFAYASLFEPFDSSGRPVTDEQSAAREALRRSVIPYLRSIATPPT